MFTFLERESGKRETRGENREAKEQCSFCVPRVAGTWVEKTPRVHQINQVTRGNCSGRPVTGPSYSSAAPVILFHFILFSY